MNFNFINDAMFFLLDQLHTLVGNYGWAIVLLTVLIRAVLWPLNSQQTRSMRKMQELQPKLKAVQEKYKDNPQKMQEAMMKFYSENSFNPLAGCLPLLVQLPIFIGLYGALNSPSFQAETVNEGFLFVNNLTSTLHSHAGKPLDGTFNVENKDTFSADHTVKVTMNSGKTQTVQGGDVNRMISVTPKPLMPGEPVKMVLDFREIGLSDDYRNRVQSADALVMNNQSRELERVHFTNQNGVLTREVPTVPGKTTWNMDVLVMLLIYGALTVLYQKVMTGRQPKAAADDPAAQAMQSPAMKFMPILFLVMFFIFPIPAGVMIYLVVTTALMFIQTVWVNWSEDRKDATKSKPSDQIIDIKADRA